MVGEVVCLLLLGYAVRSRVIVVPTPRGRHARNASVQAWPLSDVKAYRGHADISTTMIYVHHVPQVDAAEKLTRLVAGNDVQGGLLGTGSIYAAAGSGIG